MLVISFVACQEDNENPNSNDGFDRQVMLANWADNIIIPVYTDFAEKTTALKAASEAFVTDPSAANYDDLATKWETAYLTFQEVSMFEIGKAEEVRLTNNLNIYPTDIDGISSNILDDTYNFELPSQIAMQGFPALDYMLFGVAADKATILNFYQGDADAALYLDYVKALTHRIDDLAQAVLADWKGDYRNSFVENSSNDALSSVDKLTNDFLFYYEKHLRAGKIGIPAGVFSGNPLSEKVEAFYKQDLNKALFMRSLDAVQDFFNGKAYNSTSEGESMKAYLNYLGTQKNDASLSTAINHQFDAARTTAESLNDNFAQQVMDDNTKMLATYDQLQLNVVNIKVDMLQAFNINVDYIDADGD